MNELVLFTGNTLPTLIDAAGDRARALPRILHRQYP